MSLRGKYNCRPSVLNKTIDSLEVSIKEGKLERLELKKFIEEYERLLELGFDESEIREMLMKRGFKELILELEKEAIKP